MNSNNVLQAGLFIVVLLACAVPMSRYLSAVMDGSSRVVRLGEDGKLEELGRVEIAVSCYQHSVCRSCCLQHKRQ